MLYDEYMRIINKYMLESKYMRLYIYKVHLIIFKYGVMFVFNYKFIFEVSLILPSSTC